MTNKILKGNKEEQEQDLGVEITNLLTSQGVETTISEDGVGRIVIMKDITEELLEDVIDLYDLDKDEDVKEIEIFLDTSGGDIIAGFAFCDALRNITKPTTLRVLSKAYSMGFFIVLAANSNPNITVECGESTTFLLHSMSVGYDRMNLKGLNETFSFHNKLNERVKSFTLKYSNFTEEEVVRYMEAETFFFADELLERGLIDKIL